MSDQAQTALEQPQKAYRGVIEPRIWTKSPDLPSLGIDFIEFCESIGFTLLPWQQFLAHELCKVTEDDKWWAGAGRSLAGAAAGHAMTLEPGTWRRVDGRGEPLAAGAFAGQRAHAVAGIGHPPRFFAQLRAIGIVPVEHPFPDHHVFARGDLAFGDELPVLMTEKDAVKCGLFADERCWYLPVEARLDPILVPRIEEKLRGSQAA